MDKNKRVVQLRENFRPFRMIIAKKPAKYMIELANGTIKKSKTLVNDKISF